MHNRAREKRQNQKQYTEVLLKADHWKLMIMLWHSPQIIEGLNIAIRDRVLKGKNKFKKKNQENVMNSWGYSFQPLGQ